MGTTQGGSAADVYATLPGSYRDYIRYLFDDSRTKIVCDVIKAMEIEIHNNTYDEDLLNRFSNQVGIPSEYVDLLLTDMLGWVTQTVDARIEQLKKEVNEAEIRRKLDYALGYISTEMGKILAQLDVEHPEDPAEFVIKDLTVRVKNPSRTR